MTFSKIKFITELKKKIQKELLGKQHLKMKRDYSILHPSI